jgi:acyl-CoA thioesterase
MLSMSMSVDPELIEKIGRDPFARSLGIEIVELRAGYSKLSMTVREEMLNFHGIPHGGAIFSLADAAFAAASNSHGTQAVALQMSISYLAAVPVGTTLYAEATEEKLGKRTALYQIKVTDADGKLIASCQGLVYRQEKPL